MKSGGSSRPTAKSGVPLTRSQTHRLKWRATITPNKSKVDSPTSSLRPSLPLRFFDAAGATSTTSPSAAAGVCNDSIVFVSERSEPSSRQWCLYATKFTRGVRRMESISPRSSNTLDRLSKQGPKMTVSAGFAQEQLIEVKLCGGRLARSSRCPKTPDRTQGARARKGPFEFGG